MVITSGGLADNSEEILYAVLAKAGSEKIVVAELFCDVSEQRESAADGDPETFGASFFIRPSSTSFSTAAVFALIPSSAFWKLHVFLFRRLLLCNDARSFWAGVLVLQGFFLDNQDFLVRRTLRRYLH